MHYLNHPCPRCGAKKLAHPRQSGSKLVVFCYACGQNSGQRKDGTIYLLGGRAKERKTGKTWYVPERMLNLTSEEITERSDYYERMKK